MLKIGLTGGIGSGKSIVAKIFAAMGVPVYNSDAEAKRLMNEDEVLKSRIIQLFGVEAYNNDKLNTSFLASLVFRDKSLLEKLNHIVHPAVGKDYAGWLDEHSQHAYVIQESAIIFEQGLKHLFDRVIVVDAPADLRVERVMKRDNVKADKVRERMKMQLPAEEKTTGADHVIVNDGNQLLIPQVLKLHNYFVSLQAEKK